MLITRCHTELFSAGTNGGTVTVKLVVLERCGTWDRTIARKSTVVMDVNSTGKCHIICYVSCCSDSQRYTVGALCPERKVPLSQKVSHRGRSKYIPSTPPHQFSVLCRCKTDSSEYDHKVLSNSCGCKML